MITRIQIGLALALCLLLWGENIAQAAQSGTMPQAAEVPSASTVTDQSQLMVNGVIVSTQTLENELVAYVKPVYPHLAKLAHVEGKVVLQGRVDKKGQIKNLRVVSGHPLLVQATLDTVKQWRYKPLFCEGRPADFDALISINFVLEKQP